MEVYYVYIIESELDGTLYKGFSTDYIRRLGELKKTLYDISYVTNKNTFSVHVKSYERKVIL